MEHMQMFLLIDAYKRLLASQFKGARSQAKAITEYDERASDMARTKPEQYKRFCTLFGLSPAATGRTLIGA